MHYLIHQWLTWLPYPSQDLSTQVYIVTGSNGGLGYEAAKHLVRLNAAKVVLGVRNLEGGKRAAMAIERATNAKGVCDVWHLDMGSYASIKAFAARMDRELDRIDGVLLNAGISSSVGSPRLSEKDETVLTVNVVCTTLLACMSVPVLRKSAARYDTKPRISVTSSGTHAWAEFPEKESDSIFDALNEPAKDNKVERYCVSKLLEIFSIRELARMVDERRGEPQVIINTLAPGFCSTDLVRHLSGVAAIYMNLRMALLARSAEQGSRTLVHAVLGDEETHGKYLADCEASETRLADFVKSEEGYRAQQKYWKELESKLESIQPGAVTAI